MRTSSVVAAAVLSACGGSDRVVMEQPPAEEPAIPQGLVLAFSTSGWDYDMAYPGPLFGGCVGNDPVEIAATGRYPALSPDGRLVAVTQGISVNVLDPERGTSRTVAAASTDPGYARPLGFSPDGNRLAVVTDQGLGVVELATGMLWPVTGAEDRSAGVVRWPSGSGSFLFQDEQPDGSYRLATATKGADGMWSASTLVENTQLVDAREGLLVVVDVGGTLVRRAQNMDILSPPLGELLDARISPNASRLLIQGFTPWNVETLDAKVLQFLPNAQFAAWTDEGEVVAYYGEALGLINLDSGEHRLLPYLPQVSSDNRVLYYDHDSGFDYTQPRECPAWTTKAGPGPLVGGS